MEALRGTKADMLAMLMSSSYCRDGRGGVDGPMKGE
jgi:hypothetical protein